MKPPMDCVIRVQETTRKLQVKYCESFKAGITHVVRFLSTAMLATQSRKKEGAKKKGANASRPRTKASSIQELKLLLGLDDVVSHRVAHQFADRVAIEPAHDIRAMRFRRLYAQSERNGDFFAALAFGQELHDFALSRCQAAACLVFPVFGIRFLRFLLEIAV